MSIELTLYTRAGCVLCEEAKIQLAPLVAEFKLDYHELDVDTDPKLAEKFGNDVPVIFVNNRKVAKHRIDVNLLHRALQFAARLESAL